MKRDKISVNTLVEDVRENLAKDQHVSHSLRKSVESLLFVVLELSNQINLTSKNSSKPPSSDPNRNRDSSKKPRSKNKPGGQKGRTCEALKLVSNPDKVKKLRLKKDQLPAGHDYKRSGYERRQIIDIEISRVVTEYQAEVFIDECGNRYVAKFPTGVTRPVQYGANLKAHAVYLMQYQMIPYKRTVTYFSEEMKIPVSEGSLFNFNKNAYELLEEAENFIKKQLTKSAVLHADETGIMINKKRHWLHVLSNKDWTYFYPHKKRGVEATQAMGILPVFEGVLCHDHWKPYYVYKCLHALCNAHHDRELIRALEQD